jgi:hypothetical protein
VDEHSEWTKETFAEHGPPTARNISMRDNIKMWTTHCLSLVSMEMRIGTPGAFSSSIDLRITAALRSRRTGGYAWRCHCRVSEIT